MSPSQDKSSALDHMSPVTKASLALVPFAGAMVVYLLWIYTHPLIGAFGALLLVLWWTNTLRQWDLENRLRLNGPDKAKDDDGPYTAFPAHLAEVSDDDD